MIPDGCTNSKRIACRGDNPVVWGTCICPTVKGRLKRGGSFLKVWISPVLLVNSILRLLMKYESGFILLAMAIIIPFSVKPLQKWLDLAGSRRNSIGTTLSGRWLSALILLALIVALTVPSIAQKQTNVPQADKPANGRGDVTRRQLSSAAAPPSITYHGGPLMLGTTHIYYIFYGDWKGKDPGGTAILNAFGSSIGGSPYFNINTTYYDGSNNAITNAVQLSGTITSDYAAAAPLALSDADIFGIVTRTFTQGLPADPQGVYFVLTAPGVTETSGFLTSYCGWHTYGSFNGQHIKYAFIGNASGPAFASCAEQMASSPNGDPGADAMVSVIAHELEESVTDPQLNAWYDSAGEENADKCAWTFGTTYGVANGSVANVSLGGRDFLIQQNWVNASTGYCALSLAANMTVLKTHTGSFIQGQTGASYTITAFNAGGVATSGAVTVADTLPTGLTATAISGTGWSCTLSTVTCSRSDVLAAGSSYPAITLTVSVAISAPLSVTNIATVSGGGEVYSGDNQASDPTTILSTSVPDMTILSTHSGSFTQGQNAAVYTITAFNAGSMATSGAVTVADTLPAELTATAISGMGWSCTLPTLTCSRSDVLAGGAAYPSITLTVNVSKSAPSLVTNTAKVAGGGEANTGNDTANDPTTIIGIQAGSAPLQFLTVAQCRVIDTRYPDGPFGGPFIAAGTSRSIPIPSGTCGVPANALAYSLNVTVVPRTGGLGYLTVWPTGEAQPFVSTLNSPDGSVLANAAIVPAGTAGSINAFATNDTELIIDINGYFVPPAANTLQFYALSPCRVLDTRNGNGTAGGPAIARGSGRSFPISSGSCGAPSGAAAYSLNVTVVPQGTLGYLTAWPTGQTQPLVSTLNSLDGTVLANAAIVPAGTGGAVSFYASDTTNLVVDINGYFASPGATGLNFYTVAPCRLVDTRNPNGILGGPIAGAGTTRTLPLPAGSCGLPNIPAVQAYSLNMTVVPQGPLGYLTTWPTGGTQPVVSTLNAQKGQVVANAAIVPADASSGSINVFVTNTTHVIIDTNGYFGP
jgi:uncharacterized repeat protein (TIGR01451 family)